ncbi:MAG: amidohydrolase family protein [Sphingomicrobium sp.]
MRRFILTALLATSAGYAAAAPVPVDQLLKPPADAVHYVVVSEAGKHGDEWRWTLPDGRTAFRETILLRGLVYEQDETVAYNSDGTIKSLEVRGVTPQGDSAETFAIDQGMANWRSSVDEGHAPYAAPVDYASFGGTFLAQSGGIAPLIAAGAKGLALLPSGRATLTPGPSMTVTGPAGAKTIKLHFINGLSQSPQGVWLNADGSMFGYVAGLGLLPEGYEGNLKTMIAAQDAGIAALSPATARKFLNPAARRPLLIRGVKLFDADAGSFLANQNVFVRGGRIVSVGAEPRRLPPRTRIIDGAGKTLVPGLWDSHMHMSDDFNAVSEVAIGVTSVRNPGGPIELAQSQERRRKLGTLLAPEGFTSIIVDGKGPLVAQGSLAVGSLEETLAAVRKIKAAGMTGVKFYTSMKPEWIPPAAKLAHELGLHVHGHIPAGMRTLDAVNAGYDEITHIYFATMQAMPQDVVDKSNTTLRMTGPARYFKDVDFTAEPMKSTIATLAAKQIVIDPTLVVVETVLTNEAGKVGPSYAPYIGTLPPATERGFKAGPIPLPEGTSREDARKSFAHMVDYVVVLRKAGVPIVAGTDGSGIELLHELELYVKGGMTSAEALQTATIAAARNVRADGRTGSIKAGKEADLLLVDGDVEADIGNLRHVDKVVLDGALLDGAELRAAAGFSGAPK